MKKQTTTSKKKTDATAKTATGEKVPKAAKSKSTKKIEKSMYIYEVTKQNPKAAYIMMNHGLYCAGCHGAMYETVEQGAKVHGLSEQEIEQMIDELNADAKLKKKESE